MLPRRSGDGRLYSSRSKKKISAARQEHSERRETLAMTIGARVKNGPPGDGILEAGRLSIGRVRGRAAGAVAGFARAWCSSASP